MEENFNNKLPTIRELTDNDPVKKEDALIVKVSIIAIIIIILVIGSYIAFSIYKDKKQSAINNSPTTALSVEAVTRLQNYPYEATPKLSFQQILVEMPDVASWIRETFLTYFLKLEVNEKFFTDNKLTYLAYDNHFAIRGILQVKQQDGSYTEQDVEYQFRYGEWNEDNTVVKLVYEGKRLLDSRKIIRGDGK